MALFFTIPSIVAALTFAAQFVLVTTLQDYLRTNQDYRSIPLPDEDRHIHVSHALDEVQNLLADDVEQLAEALHVAEISSSGRDPYGELPLGASSYLPAVNTQPSSGLQVESLQAIPMQACPNGYYLTPGDVPGGDSFGRGFTNQVDSIDACSADCDGRPACLSFEYSTISRNCYLNTIVTPTHETFGDTLFCAKTDALAEASLEIVTSSMNATGNLTKSNATSNSSNATGNATSVGNVDVASEPEGAGEWLTFHGRISEALGYGVWGVAGVAMTCFFCCVLYMLTECLKWLCNGDYVGEVKEDEDLDLHEAWVRAPSKVGAGGII